MRRYRISVRGAVQGVGFRPFVHRLASRLHLAGFVQNVRGGVRIEVEGDEAPLRQLLDCLIEDSPRSARIDSLETVSLASIGERGFRIESSRGGGSGEVRIPADTATCDECLRELWDPSDRRYRYPFICCTQCGPRLTILEGVPYDRQRTTMAKFQMCDRCADEFADPANRRFHAQPNACPQCGPRLELLGPGGDPTESADPLADFARAVTGGQIGALKSLGGFHLVCDAAVRSAVKSLRVRKRREAKPLAIMVADLAAARAICEVNEREGELLTSPRRPIVLLRKRAETWVGDTMVSDPVAPHERFLGVMLPSAPVHHLLLNAVGRRPLVMTSGNASGEPIAYREKEAVDRLGGIADLFLTHDRPVAIRADDSVTRVVSNQEAPLRCSRGDAPLSLRLPQPCLQPTLAVGGQLKNTFALAAAGDAVLSHHIGDLGDYGALVEFERDLATYENLFGIRPRRIVHDLHPDYASTRYAERRAAAEGLELVAVQHHHAHMASCIAEHGLRETVIGVCFDGTGYGTDGAIWGGEFLVGDDRAFSRLAHLKYVRMPGGEQAIREPWRMAVAHLFDAGVRRPWRNWPADGIDASPHERDILVKMIRDGINSPWTSSAGRLFDAVAAILGVRTKVSFEGQAAAELESLAIDQANLAAYPFRIRGTLRTIRHATATEASALNDILEIDLGPCIRAIAREVAAGVNRERIARRFHSTMVEVIVRTCLRIREATRTRAVVLSGGTFLNTLLSHEVDERLAGLGFLVHRHRKVPCGDGGLCLGQLAVAAARNRRADDGSSPTEKTDVPGNTR